MGEKITKEGSKNHQKYPRTSAKLVNEGVTKSSKGKIFQGKEFLEEKVAEKLPRYSISKVEGTQDEQL